MESEKIDEIIEEAKHYTGIDVLDFKNASPEDIDSFIFETLKVAIQKTSEQIFEEIEELYEFVSDGKSIIMVTGNEFKEFKKKWLQ